MSSPAMMDFDSGPGPTGPIPSRVMDVCRERLSEDPLAVKPRLSNHGRPVRLWVNDDLSLFCLTDAAILKLVTQPNDGNVDRTLQSGNAFERQNETIQVWETVFEIRGRVLDSHVYDNRIAILAKLKKEKKVGKVEEIAVFEYSRGASKQLKILPNKGPAYTWILMIDGKHLNKRFFCHLRGPDNLNTSQLFIIVGDMDGCVQCFPADKYLLSESDTLSLLNMENSSNGPEAPRIGSKFSFMHVYLNREEEQAAADIDSHPSSFAALKDLVMARKAAKRLNTEKNSSMFLLDAMKDCQITPEKKIIALSHGELSLCTWPALAAKTTLMSKVDLFSLMSDRLTVMTKNGEIYHGQLTDFESKPKMVPVLMPRKSTPRVGDEESNFVLDQQLDQIRHISSSIHAVGMATAREKHKLQQLKLFSLVQQGVEILRCELEEVRFHMSRLTASQFSSHNGPPIIKLKLTFHGTETIRLLDRDYFSIHLSVQMGRTARQVKHLELIQSLRPDDFITAEIPLAVNLGVECFPLIVRPNLILIGEALDSDHYRDLCPSRHLMGCTVSPLYFASPLLSAKDRSQLISSLNNRTSSEGYTFKSTFLAALDFNTTEEIGTDDRKRIGNFLEHETKKRRLCDLGQHLTTELDKDSDKLAQTAETATRMHQSKKMARRKSSVQISIRLLENQHISIFNDILKAVLNHQTLLIELFEQVVEMKSGDRVPCEEDSLVTLNLSSECPATLQMISREL